MTTTNRTDYSAASLAALERRLPKQEWLTVSDVAGACDLSANGVRAHMEAGTFHAMNFGASEEHPFMKIFRQSVVDFYKRRLGIGD
jgi:hypothetical protein